MIPLPRIEIRLPLMPIGQLKGNIGGVVHVEDVLDYGDLNCRALHQIAIAKHHFIRGF
ncbi:hypothetical protein VCR3J2_310188 [Vibrio coralliirubri]|nr:hypothetical protein VCR3J2_310188 [Vibrio coralliirubri]